MFIGEYYVEVFIVKARFCAYWKWFVIIGLNMLVEPSTCAFLVMAAASARGSVEPRHLVYHSAFAFWCVVGAPLAVMDMTIHRVYGICVIRRHTVPWLSIGKTHDVVCKRGRKGNMPRRAVTESNRSGQFLSIPFAAPAGLATRPLFMI